VLLVLAAACNNPKPDGASLAAEPVLDPLPGEVELAAVRIQPRAGRIGVPGRDGVVERVVAVDLAPQAAADLVQQRHGNRYAFRRVDLGGESPVTVELRGTSPTGAEVIVTASTDTPVPLYGGLDEVRPVPPQLATTMVISVVSAQ
jgi:hypothetical protein